MEILNTELENRTDFLKRIGPDIARQMTSTLQKLTGEEVKVEFGGVRTFEQNTVSVDVEEKCFGTYVPFASPADAPVIDGGGLKGVVVAVFPLSGNKVLTELLLKRYLKKRNEESIDGKMKLSIFKEAVSILVLTYITEVSNAFKVKLKTGVPKFVYFRNAQLSKGVLLGDILGRDGLISVGQYNIIACNAECHNCEAGQPVESYPSLIKGCFIVVF